MKGYSSVDLNSVAPLTPANKTAALVSSKGEHFAFNPARTRIHSSTPLPLREVFEKERANPGFADLTGKRIGRLTVQGIAAIVSGGGANWSVRCVCGTYETRKAKFIKACLAGNNPGKEEPMCDWCGKTRKLQLGIGVVRKDRGQQ
jgi:hypothetical protein